MKKFILYISIIFAANFAFASQLNLQFAYAGDYRVILNGVVYNVHGDVINIAKIRGGYHHLKVIESVSTGYGTFSQHVIYNSTITIPSRSDVYAGLYNAHSLDVNEIVYYGRPINTVNYLGGGCSYANVRYISYTNYNTYHHNNYYYRNRYRNCHTNYGYRNNTVNNNGHVHNSYHSGTVRNNNRPRNNTMIRTTTTTRNTNNGAVRKTTTTRNNTNRTVRTTTTRHNRNGTVRTTTRKNTKSTNGRRNTNSNRNQPRTTATQTTVKYTAR